MYLCLPQAHSQHRFQKLFDVLLDTGSHGSCQHTNAGEDCGINLHRLLPPGKGPHNYKELLFFKHLSSSYFCVISLTEILLISIQEFDPTLKKLHKEQVFPFLPLTFTYLLVGKVLWGKSCFYDFKDFWQVSLKLRPHGHRKQTQGLESCCSLLLLLHTTENMIHGVWKILISCPQEKKIQTVEFI